jgi:RNA polymerase sigma factor (TIGR02999 family)
MTQEGEGEVTAKGDGTITEQLRAWRAGDHAAMSSVFSELHSTLHQLAERALARERTSHTLGTAGLISEAWFRLIEQRRTEWQSREQFVAAAAQMMRRILVDYARARSADKRGAGERPLPLDDDLAPTEQPLGQIVAIHDALEILEGIDREQSAIVELRFFGGLGHDEIARHLGVSVPTVERRWRLARAWLYRHLTSEAP